MSTPQLTITAGTYFGCDPELFLTQNGNVIGAEKFMAPADTEKFVKTNNATDYVAKYIKKFVLDGVQLELNPSPNTCRANLGNEIRYAFQALKKHLATTGTVSACFNTVVDIDQAELDSLSDNAKVFGCAQSLNSYDKAATITVNAATYLKRTAGGHIHLGLPANLNVDPIRERLVPILDVVLGNTCVMIDRDPYAPERRKNYGRAGEYRLPKHGLEYRTLSNFWLRSYQLMSFVMGMARLGVSILDANVQVSKKPGSYGYYPKTLWDAETELFKNINLEAVRVAINTNDLDLAKENYKAVRGFISKHVPNGGGIGYDAPLTSTTLDAFDFFCRRVQKKGIEYWFPQDPLEHWCSNEEGHGTGWESFLQKTVTPKLNRVLARKKLRAAKIAAI
jgi:hypothetical protein